MLQHKLSLIDVCGLTRLCPMPVTLISPSFLLLFCSYPRSPLLLPPPCPPLCPLATLCSGARSVACPAPSSAPSIFLFGLHVTEVRAASG